MGISLFDDKVGALHEGPKSCMSGEGSEIIGWYPMTSTTLVNNVATIDGVIWAL